MEVDPSQTKNERQQKHQQRRRRAALGMGVAIVATTTTTFLALSPGRRRERSGGIIISISPNDTKNNNVDDREDSHVKNVFHPSVRRGNKRRRRRGQEEDAALTPPWPFPSGHSPSDIDTPTDPHHNDPAGVDGGGDDATSMTTSTEDWTATATFVEVGDGDGDVMATLLPMPPDQVMPLHTDPVPDFGTTTMMPPLHTDPVDQFHTTTTTTTTAATSTSEVPFHTDPVDQFNTTTTTTSTATPEPPFHTDPVDQFDATTTGAATPKIDYWWPLHPEGNERTDCVLNNDYPDDYLNPSVMPFLLFADYGACCDAYEGCLDYSLDEDAAGTTTAPPYGDVNGDANGGAATPKIDYWWPLHPEGNNRTVCVLNNDYPDDYLNPPVMPLVLFAEYGACCDAYEGCWEYGSNEDADGGSATATAATTTAPNNLNGDFNGDATGDANGDANGGDATTPIDYWYPQLHPETGLPTCHYGTDYPTEYTLSPEYTTAFLFDTQVDCCVAFPLACVGMFWYPADHGGCTFGVVNEEESDMGGIEEYFLFITREECCAKWCTHDTGTSAGGGEGGAGGTESTVAAVTTGTVGTVASTVIATTTEFATTTTTSTTTNATPTDPCTECTWHESLTAYQTCTNTPEYPPAWDEYPAARAYFFFHTAEECCATRFSNGCTVEDVRAEQGGGGAAGEGGDNGSGSGSTTDGDDGNEGASSTDEYHTFLGPRTIEDFDGAIQGLPFQFHGWTYDTTTHRSSSFSATNIPSTRPGASTDLTLKVRVTSPTMISCMGKIDTSMPFEIFTMLVNGQQRNTYYEPVMRMGEEEEQWIEILTGLGPGENIVTFRVQNSGRYDASAMERVGVFGTGRVWLDDCAVSSV